MTLQQKRNIMPLFVDVKETELQILDGLCSRVRKTVNNSVIRIEMGTTIIQ